MELLGAHCICVGGVWKNNWWQNNSGWSQDGKDKNGQLESCPIFIIYPFVSLRAVLSKFDVYSVLRVRIHRFADERRS